MAAWTHTPLGNSQIQTNLQKHKNNNQVGDAVVRLWTLAVKGKGGLGDVLECLEAQVAPAMDALYRKLDKKREKALVRALFYAWVWGFGGLGAARACV